MEQRNNMKRQYNCIIVVGEEYNAYINLIKYQETLKKIKILGILSNWKSIIGFDGYPSLIIEDLSKIDYDYLIITDTKNFVDISKAISEAFNISRDKIISSIAFKQPNFDFIDYVKLMKSDLTIISIECSGAVMYNALGLEFKSPFILMFLTQKDYLKVMNDFEYYIRQPLIEVKDLDRKYPVGKLDDVYLYLNHYSTFDDAKIAWDKRIQRINKNNVLFMMTEVFQDSIEKFQNCTVNRKIGFAPEDYNLDLILNMDNWIYYQDIYPDFPHLIRRTCDAEIDLSPYTMMDLLLDEKFSKRRYKYEENTLNETWENRIKYCDATLHNTYKNRIRLARMYIEGYHLPKNLEKAQSLLEGVIQERPNEREKLISRLAKTKNSNEEILAFKLVEKCFEGDEGFEFMGHLGRAYRDGRGVPRDLDKAAEWMRKAADKNVGWAKNELFDILWKINTPESHKEMISVAKVFAEAGDGGAMGRLGRAYRDGRGVEQDLDKAAEWMRKAADKNVGWAKNELSKILL